MKKRFAPRYQREKRFKFSFVGSKENTSTRKTTLLCGRNKKLFNFYLKNRI